VISLTLQLFAQTGPISSAQPAPWEAAAGFTFTRADIQAIPKALAASGTGLNAGRLLNMGGAEVVLQQNFRDNLGFQFDLSAAIGKRPVAGRSFNPLLYTGNFGPIVRLRPGHNVDPWIRIAAGGAHADLRPDAVLKADIRSKNAAYAFSNSSLAAQVGAGADWSLTRHVSLRAGFDLIRTYLFSAHQNQLRSTIGVTWQFGGGRYDW
jgi:opacity protein-like surface antigen